MSAVKITLELPSELVERAKVAGISLDNLKEIIITFIEQEIIHREQVVQLADYCKANLKLIDIVELGDQYGYPSLPLCIIDALFSIGVVYTSTHNTVNRFKAYYPNSESLSISDFIALYRQNSLEFMTQEVYKNRQRTSPRGGILKAEVVLHVAEVLAKHGVETLTDMPKVIRHPAFEADYKQISGQSSGVSLRYLYMLVGVKDEIKPDRMVWRFIESALNRPVKDEAECVKLILAASQLLNADFPDLNPRSLDYAIWQYQKGQKA